jgi:hypothetical protein
MYGRVSLRFLLDLRGIALREAVKRLEVVFNNQIPSKGGIYLD